VILVFDGLDLPFFFIFFFECLCEGQHKKQEEDWGHYVALFDSLSILNVSAFAPNVHDEDESIVQSCYDVNEIIRHAILVENSIK